MISYTHSWLHGDVVNISAGRTDEGLIVTFGLFNHDDADLARDVAKEHGFEQYGDTGERFES